MIVHLELQIMIILKWLYYLLVYKNVRLLHKEMLLLHKEMLRLLDFKILNKDLLLYSEKEHKQ